ncbi:hypothetical protein BJ741DRAFT_610833 [Chytriomyces cf. hyalinus JEL632]|nr:hypothetical protein BJ741DRAFT_610833 [Chytriomyces cf. hyalinus JEL632]
MEALLANGFHDDNYILSKEGVRCVCGSVEDSGVMISCDICTNWLHCKCVGLPDFEAALPAHFECSFCLSDSLQSTHSIHSALSVPPSITSISSSLSDVSRRSSLSGGEDDDIDQKAHAPNLDMITPVDNRDEAHDVSMHRRVLILEANVTQLMNDMICLKQIQKQKVTSPKPHSQPSSAIHSSAVPRFTTKKRRRKNYTSNRISAEPASRKRMPETIAELSVDPVDHMHSSNLNSRAESLENAAHVIPKYSREEIQEFLKLRCINLTGLDFKFCPQYQEDEGCSNVNCGLLHRCQFCLDKQEGELDHGFFRCSQAMKATQEFDEYLQAKHSLTLTRNSTPISRNSSPGPCENAENASEGSSLMSPFHPFTDEEYGFDSFNTLNHDDLKMEDADLIPHNFPDDMDMDGGDAFETIPQIELQGIQRKEESTPHQQQNLDPGAPFTTITTATVQEPRALIDAETKLMMNAYMSFFFGTLVGSRRRREAVCLFHQFNLCKNDEISCGKVHDCIHCGESDPVHDCPNEEQFANEFELFWIQRDGKIVCASCEGIGHVFLDCLSPVVSRSPSFEPSASMSTPLSSLGPFIVPSEPVLPSPHGFGSVNLACRKSPTIEILKAEIFEASTGVQLSDPDVATAYQNPTFVKSPASSPVQQHQNTDSKCNRASEFEMTEPRNDWTSFDLMETDAEDSAQLNFNDALHILPNYGTPSTKSPAKNVAAHHGTRVIKSVVKSVGLPGSLSVVQTPAKKTCTKANYPTIQSPATSSKESYAVSPFNQSNANISPIPESPRIQSDCPSMESEPLKSPNASSTDKLAWLPMNAPLFSSLVESPKVTSTLNLQIKSLSSTHTSPAPSETQSMFEKSKTLTVPLNPGPEDVRTVDNPDAPAKIATPFNLSSVPGLSDSHFPLRDVNHDDGSITGRPKNSPFQSSPQKSHACPDSSAEIGTTSLPLTVITSSAIKRAEKQPTVSPPKNAFCRACRLIGDVHDFGADCLFAEDQD